MLLCLRDDTEEHIDITEVFTDAEQVLLVPVFFVERQCMSVHFHYRSILTRENDLAQEEKKEPVEPGGGSGDPVVV